MNYDAAPSADAGDLRPSASAGYLPAGLPVPVPENDGLSKPYWDGLQANRVMVQRCDGCSTIRFGPEWICHQCHSLAFTWIEIEPRGIIYSWERVWHPVHPRLQGHGAYLVVLVELPGAGSIRMLGNLLGDPQQDVRIGAQVRGVFEHHADGQPAYSLLQWTLDDAQ